VKSWSAFSARSKTITPTTSAIPTFQPRLNAILP
jgi:hypothetical protein